MSRPTRTKFIWELHSTPVQERRLCCGHVDPCAERRSRRRQADVWCVQHGVVSGIIKLISRNRRLCACGWAHGTDSATRARTQSKIRISSLCFSTQLERTRLHADRGKERCRRRPRAHRWYDPTPPASASRRRVATRRPRDRRELKRAGGRHSWRQALTGTVGANRQ